MKAEGENIDMADIALSHGNVFGELAQISLEAYGAGRPEPYVWEGGTTPAAEALALARGWAPLTASDFGIAPTADPVSGLRYEFINGFYQADITGQQGTTDAYVLQGTVNGDKTLLVAFRGSDEFPGDNFDYLDFNRGLAKFAAIDQPLLDYVDDPSHGIEQVLVTGHSLGASVADQFMEQEGVRGDARFKAVTFGSPGGDFPADLREAVANDPRIVDFAHTHDAVPLNHQPAGVLFGSDPTFGDDVLPSALGVLGLVTLATHPDSPSLALLAGLPPEALLDVTLHPPRTLPGGEVQVAIDVPGGAPDYGYGLVEHNARFYVQSVDALIDLAQDPANPFHGTALAAAIRAQDPAGGGPALDTFVSLDPDVTAPPEPPFSGDKAGSALEDALRAAGRVAVSAGNGASQAVGDLERLAGVLAREAHSGGSSDLADHFPQADHLEPGLAHAVDSAAHSADWFFRHG
jgi:Lipase (class 3)